MRKSRQYASVASSRRAESAIQCHGLFIPFRIRWVSIFALSPIRLPVLLWESRVSTCQYHLQYYLHVKYYFALPPLTHSGLSKSVYYISSFVSVGIRVYPGPKFTALVNSYHFGIILRTIKTQEIPHTFVLYVYTPRVLPTYILFLSINIITLISKF